MTAVFAASYDEPMSDVSEAEILAALDRVLSDDEFKRNSNSVKFLKFVVEETIAGRSARLKAFTIATLALQRSDSFNPQANSTVRVQAKRLRDLLQAYYEGAGSSDPICISLPIGTYQPQFSRRDVSPPTRSAEAIDLGSPSNENAPLQFDPKRDRAVSVTLFWIFVAVIVAVTICLASLAFRPIFQAGLSEDDVPPVVMVEAPQFDSHDFKDASLPTLVQESVESGLEEFDYLDVRRHDAARRPGSRVDYVVRGRFTRSAGANWDIEMRVLREPTGDVIAIRRFENVSLDDKASLDAAIASTIAAAGDVGTGAIFQDVRARLARVKAPLEGYRCYIAGEEYLRDRVESQRVLARECLEAEVRAHPENYRAMSDLAQILTMGYFMPTEGARGAEDLARADALAKRAVELAPFRADAQFALFMADFYQKRFEESYRAARQAMATNPYSSLISIAVAKAWIARARYSDGLAILEPLDRAASGALPTGDAYLALAAHMRGDAEAAFRYAARPNASALPLGIMMRIITCHERNLPECVTSSEALLREAFPDFAIDVGAALEKRAISKSIKTALLKDLAETGYIQTTQR